MAMTHVPGTFRHDVCFYEGDDGFVDAVLDFLREGVERAEPTLVVVRPTKISALRDALGADAGRVQFADMDEVGRNPAHIIPAWRDFVDGHARPGVALRGVGEPITGSRRGAELVECQRHEVLLDVAFAAGHPWWLVCPYDVRDLEPSVVAAAAHAHDASRPACVRAKDPRLPGEVLAAPGGPVRARAFAGVRALRDMRAFAADALTHLDVAPARRDELLVAITELATNSIFYGGGGGMLRVWREGQTVICEVEDAGHVDDPLAGRRKPAPREPSGRGLWIVNQICDLVQLRSNGRGTVVRVHLRDRCGSCDR